MELHASPPPHPHPSPPLELQLWKPITELHYSFIILGVGGGGGLEKLPLALTHTHKGSIAERFLQSFGTYSAKMWCTHNIRWYMKIPQRAHAQHRYMLIIQSKMLIKQMRIANFARIEMTSYNKDVFFFFLLANMDGIRITQHFVFFFVFYLFLGQREKISMAPVGDCDDDRKKGSWVGSFFF